jgi:hypothetical protein
MGSGPTGSALAVPVIANSIAVDEPTTTAASVTNFQTGDMCFSQS